jgi:hypothetical protein
MNNKKEKIRESEEDENIGQEDREEKNIKKGKIIEKEKQV